MVSMEKQSPNLQKVARFARIISQGTTLVWMEQDAGNPGAPKGLSAANTKTLLCSDPRFFCEKPLI